MSWIIAVVCEATCDRRTFLKYWEHRKSGLVNKIDLPRITNISYSYIVTHITALNVMRECTTADAWLCLHYYSDGG
jgi:hypothetical protein